MTNDRPPRPRRDPDREPGAPALSSAQIERLERIADQDERREAARRDRLAWWQHTASNTLSALLLSIILAGPVAWVKQLLLALWAKLSGP
jgi:hypothetical protein